MDYMREISAFYDMAETSELSPSCILLWHALMYQANKAWWPDRLAVPMSVLELRTSLKETAIKTARARLKQLGIIDFETRKGSQSALYLLSSLCGRLTTAIATETATESATETAPTTATETATHIPTYPSDTPVTKTKTKTNTRNFDVFHSRIDELTEYEELRGAMRDFVQMRREKDGKAFTIRALELAYSKAQKLFATPDGQTKAFLTSVERGWKSVFVTHDSQGINRVSDTPSAAAGSIGKRVADQNYEQRKYTNEYLLSLFDDGADAMGKVKP